MKKTPFFILLILPAVFLVVIADGNYIASNPDSGDIYRETPIGIFPDSVLSVLDRSCFDCHSERSGNVTAKGKLNFSGWSDYSASKKLNKLDAVCEEITQGKMPKKKYISKNPEKKLTIEEIEMICNWTETEMKKIAGE